MLPPIPAAELKINLMNTLAILPMQSSNSWQAAKSACLELSADQSDRFIEIERPFDPQESIALPRTLIHSRLSCRLEYMDFKNTLREIPVQEFG
jgi:hypothetical protein